jgi:hypothetical protein
MPGGDSAVEVLSIRVGVAPAAEEYAHTDDREQVVSHGIHHTHVAGSHEKRAPDGFFTVLDLLELLGGWRENGNGAGIAEPLDIIDVADLLLAQ